MEQKHSPIHEELVNDHLAYCRPRRFAVTTRWIALGGGSLKGCP